jgi:hypothetical protein
LLSVAATGWANPPARLDPIAPSGVAARIKELQAQYPRLCRSFVIGTSTAGRDLWALEIGAGPNRGERPALAIVAGLAGDDLTGPAIAMHVADALLGRLSGPGGLQALAEHTTYVLPCMNPDGQEASFARPTLERRYALRPVDDDRDGTPDEDGPEDLNGDGLITMMRVALDGRRVGEIEATHIVDPVEPRLLKEADRAAGEVPVYALLVEGLDNDDDAAFNEDGPGGVDLNLNFTHRYKEHSKGAGPHQVSEPESRALVDFFLGHPRIAMAVYYGPHDNIAQPPKGGDDKKKASPPADPPRRGRRGRRQQEPKGLHADDIAIYKHLSKRYSELTGIDKMSGAADDGAAFAWTYAEYGIPTFACKVWRRPVAEKKGTKEQPQEQHPTTESQPSDEAVQKPAAPEAVAGEPPASAAEPDSTPSPPDDDAKSKSKPPKKPEPHDKDAAEWLKYSETQCAGAGFIEWAPFNHPQLGSVEIGGFVPFFRSAAPPDKLGPLAEGQADFVLDLLQRFPVLSFDTPTVTMVSPSLFQISTAVVNDGYFPTGLGIAKANRRVRPVVVRLDLLKDRVLGGQRVQRLWSVPGSGGRARLRWLVQGAVGDTIGLSATSEKYGDMQIDVMLQAGGSQ